MRDSFILYRSFYEAIKDLPKDNQLELYNAIFEYSLNFKEVELSGISATVFKLIKPNLEANNQRFMNGKKPKEKQELSETEAKPKQSRSKPEANKDKDKDVNKDKDKNVDKDISERKLKFAATLEPYKQKYGRDMLNDFYRYWTEPNRSQTKFRQELERTWDLERRLDTWASRDKKFEDPTKQTSITLEKKPSNYLPDEIDYSKK